MPILPDILAPGLDVVFGGTAPGAVSAAAGHYHAGGQDRFWHLLQRAGFTGTVLQPEEDASLPAFGVGMTDLIKDVVESTDRGLDFMDSRDLERRLAPFAPSWIAFNGLAVGVAAAKLFGQPEPHHGEQQWRVGSARVFVTGDSSAATANHGPTDRSWLELYQTICT